MQWHNYLLLGIRLTNKRLLWMANNGFPLHDTVVLLLINNRCDFYIIIISCVPHYKYCNLSKVYKHGWLVNTRMTNIVPSLVLCMQWQKFHIHKWFITFTIHAQICICHNIIQSYCKRGVTAVWWHGHGVFPVRSGHTNIEMRHIKHSIQAIMVSHYSIQLFCFLSIIGVILIHSQPVGSYRAFYQCWNTEAMHSHAKEGTLCKHTHSIRLAQ